MSCRSFIQRYISTLPPGAIFTTRDVLIYGRRNNVDKAIQFLVSRQIIKRLMRGVFMCNSGKTNKPSVLEIARIKAKSFGKELLKHGLDTVADAHLFPHGNSQWSFYVDGSSSSFKYDGQRVRLRKASKKRMVMTDSPAGLAIRGVWAIGYKLIENYQFDRLNQTWLSSGVEKMKILTSKAWMPAWIGDCFVSASYLGPNPYGRAVNRS